MNQRLLDTVSDATPLQKSPRPKSEMRANPLNNNTPEGNRSLVRRGSISMVSNVMSLNIVREEVMEKEMSNKNITS